MDRVTLLGLIAATCVAVPDSAAGQARAGISDGDQVRILAPDAGLEWSVGEVLAHTSDTLTVSLWEPFARQWEVQHVPTGSIRGLEVSRGTRSNTGKGAVIGGLAGGVFGLAAGIAAAAYDCDSAPWSWGSCWYWDRAEIIPLSTVTFALVGAGVGALIGSTSRSEVWEPIRIGDLHAQATLLGEDVGLVLSMRF